MSPKSLKYTQPVAAYDAMRERVAVMLAPDKFLDPRLTVTALLGLVDADAPPLRIILGPFLSAIRSTYVAARKLVEVGHDRQSSLTNIA